MRMVWQARDSGVTQLLARLKNKYAKRRIINAIRYALEETIQEAVTASIEEKLGKVTGLMSSTTKVRASSVKEDHLTISITSEAPYAGILETGNPIIRPKNRVWLAVPLSHFRQRYEVSGQRVPSPLVFGKTTFVRKNAQGNLIVYRRIGYKGKRIEPLYVYKQSVKVPARHWFRDAIKQVAPEIRQVLRECMAEIRRS